MSTTMNPLGENTTSNIKKNEAQPGKLANTSKGKKDKKKTKFIKQKKKVAKSPWARSKTKRFTGQTSLYGAQRTRTPGPKLGHTQWDERTGAKILPKGRVDRLDEPGSHLKVQKHISDSTGLSHKEVSIEKGITIQPVGRHSRLSLAGGHQTATRGCGVNDLTTSMQDWSLNEVKGATIHPEGQQTRFDGHGAYLQPGSGVDDLTTSQKDWSAETGKGAPILPEGKHTRFSMAGGHLTGVGSGVDDLTTSQKDWSAETGKGAPILPEGKHTRFSMAGGHMTKPEGCDEHVLAHQENADENATAGKIVPRGAHSRFSDFGAHVTASEGCDEHVLAHKDWFNKQNAGDEYEWVEVEVTDDEAEASDE